MIRINNIESNDINDWRFMGQDAYLMGVKLSFKKYKAESDDWEHEHCEFCTAKISESGGDFIEGYCTLDNEYWICNKCYNDFLKMFNWVVIDN